MVVRDHDGCIWCSSDTGHLVKALVLYIDEVHDAPKDIERLEKQVRLADVTLEEFNNILQKVPASERNEEKDPNFEEWIDILELNTKNFLELCHHLEAYFPVEERTEGRARRMVRYLKWPKDKKKLDKQIRQVREYIEVLQSFLSVVHAKSGARIENAMIDFGATMEKCLANLKRVVISDSENDQLSSNIEWLFPDEILVFSKLLKELRKCARSKPTWALEQDAYQDWVKASTDGSKWLWALGRPGTGKTNIASFVADTLRDLQTVDDASSITEETVREGTSGSLPDEDSSPHGASIAIFYCSYQSSHKQDTTSIMKCLCGQFLQDLRNINPWKARMRSKLIDRLRHPRGSVRTAEVLSPLDILRLLVRDFSHPYVIVDALDENTKHFDSLLDQLGDIMSASSLKVFVTSRDGTSGALYQRAGQIKPHFLRVCPADKEISSYVTSRLKQIVDKEESGFGSAFLELLKDDSECKDITNKIVSAAEGNFLCAQLQITMLRNLTTETLRKRLNALPSTLASLFSDTMDRVFEADRANNHKLGQRALIWALYAKRALTVSELSHALATYSTKERRQSIMRKQYVPTAQEIVDSTCYFLDIDGDSHFVQVHMAVKDYCQHYFDNTDRLDLDKVQFEMTGVCLHYLIMEDFHSGHCTSSEEWQDRISKTPFFEYAACNWGWHAKECEAQLLKDQTNVSLARLLKKKHIVSCIGQALQSTQQDLAGIYLEVASYGDLESTVRWTERKRSDPPIMPAPHILTSFGLQEILDDWLCKKKDDVNCLSPTQYTPLYLACHRGYTSVVELLLEHGADPGLENGHGRFCLATAVKNGHLNIVELLLSHGKENNSEESLLRQFNWYGRSVLVDAMEIGRTDILRTLLDHAASVDRRSELLLHQDNHGRGMLHTAAWFGHHEAIDIVIKASSPQDSQALLCQAEDGWMILPLHCAVLSAEEESIKALIKAGAELTGRENQGKTPLHLAASYAAAADTKVISLLLSLGADPCLRDDHERTALHDAATNNVEVIQALLSDPRTKNCLEARDDRGRTPLEVAREDCITSSGAIILTLRKAAAPVPEDTSPQVVTES